MIVRARSFRVDLGNGMDIFIFMGFRDEKVRARVTRVEKYFPYAQSVAATGVSSPEREDWLTGDAGRADPETPMQARLGRKKVAKFGEKSNEAGAAAAPRAENFPWCAHPRP